MKIQRTNPSIPEPDVTPMIDIVFQLIAFFMVISNFEQVQADERVKLPRDALAKPPEVKPEHELVINIGYVRDKDGNILDKTPYIFEPGSEFRIPDYAARLQQEKRLYRAQGVDPKDVTVVIRADADVPTGLVQELIRMAQQAEFQKFALKAIQKTE